MLEFKRYNWREDKFVTTQKGNCAIFLDGVKVGRISSHVGGFGVFINGVYWRSDKKYHVRLRGGVAGVSCKRLHEARSLVELLTTAYRERILDRSGI